MTMVPKVDTEAAAASSPDAPPKPGGEAAAGKNGGAGAGAKTDAPATDAPAPASASAAAATDASSAPVTLTPSEAEEALESFAKILTYPTVSATAPSTGAYVDCASYLLERLRSVPCLEGVGLLDEAPDHSPVVVAVWRGADEGLPVILLNSHYDVVPAETKERGGGWTVPPFEGMRRDGRVYGRGAQDMKCVCIQYIEAIRKLHTIKPSYRPQRSIYLTFVPDEEVGGSGMAAVLSSAMYKSLPGIALALDEGLASTTDTYSVFYGERLPWWVDVTATGPTGHGSRFIESTAVEQIVELANRALAFRKGQRDALHGPGGSDHSNCSHAVAAKRRRMAKEKVGSKMMLGDVTSLNVTTLEAGVRAGDEFVYNCVPPSARCSLDIRISPHTDPSEMGSLLDGWCRESSADPENGHRVEWSYVRGQHGGASLNDMKRHSLTSTDPAVNPWYAVFKSAIEGQGLTMEPEVFPAATDSRFLRALGVRALGFSPMRRSEILLHEDDEYLDEAVFLEGVGVYVGIIEMLGSQGEEVDKVAGKAEGRD